MDNSFGHPSRCDLTLHGGSMFGSAAVLVAQIFASSGCRVASFELQALRCTFCQLADGKRWCRRRIFECHVSTSPNGGAAKRRDIARS